MLVLRNFEPREDHHRLAVPVGDEVQLLGARLALAHDGGTDGLRDHDRGRGHGAVQRHRLHLRCDELYSSPDELYSSHGHALIYLKLRTVRSQLYRRQSSRSNTRRRSHENICKIIIMPK